MKKRKAEARLKKRIALYESNLSAKPGYIRPGSNNK